MTLWEQYNAERLLSGTLGEITGLSLAASDEKALFALLKRRLTRRELRCFAMNAGGVDTREIAEQLQMEIDEIPAVLSHVRKKIRQPKLRDELEALLREVPEAEDEAPL